MPASASASVASGHTLSPFPLSTSPTTISSFFLFHLFSFPLFKFSGKFLNFLLHFVPNPNSQHTFRCRFYSLHALSLFSLLRFSTLFDRFFHVFFFRNHVNTLFCFIIYCSCLILSTLYVKLPMQFVELNLLACLILHMLFVEFASYFWVLYDNLMFLYDLLCL